MMARRHETADDLDYARERPITARPHSAVGDTEIDRGDAAINGDRGLADSELEHEE